MALVRPPPGELNPPSANEISTDDAEQFVLLEKPEKERVHQLLRIPAKFSVFLILAICYLTFCIIVRYRIVPIGPRGVLGVPFLHREQ
jgi:hypothetical protein